MLTGSMLALCWLVLHILVVCALKSRSYGEAIGKTMAFRHYDGPKFDPNRLLAPVLAYLKPVLGRLGLVLACHGSVLACLGRVLGLSWPALGLSWVCLGPVLACLRSTLACLGPFLGCLGLPWPVLGQSWPAARLSSNIFQHCAVRNCCNTSLVLCSSCVLMSFQVL